MTHRRGVPLRFLLGLCFLGPAALAINLQRIEGNSLLLEEAFNQKPNEYQLIESVDFRNRDRVLTNRLTLEIPVTDEEHQLSATLPITRVNGDTGLGDATFSYRYGLLQTGNVRLTPRATLVLPTGDYVLGHGSGSIAFNGAMAATFLLNERWMLHLNAGLTYTPDSRAPPALSAWTLGINYGVGLNYMPRKWVNFLFELAGTVNDKVTTAGVVKDKVLYMNPGVRFAVNSGSDFQFVPALSFPVSLFTGGINGGVMLYLSFEKKFGGPPVQKTDDPGFEEPGWKDI